MKLFIKIKLLNQKDKLYKIKPFSIEMTQPITIAKNNQYKVIKTQHYNGLVNLKRKWNKIQMKFKQILSNIFNSQKKIFKNHIQDNFLYKLQRKCFNNIPNIKQQNQLNSNIKTVIKELRKKNSEGIFIHHPLVHDGIQKFLKQSLNSVYGIIYLKLNKVQQTASQMAKYINDSTSALNYLMRENPIHKFDKLSKNPQINIDQFSQSVTANLDYSYQMALMTPFIGYGEYESKSSILRFKINKITSNWIAVGVAHKSIIQNNSYVFKYNKIGHGAYMISANGGSWSHIKNQFNNKVKAFNFKKDDIISCIINRDKHTVTFIKQRKALDFSQKLQTYELQYSPIQNDPLYPCVTIHYQSDQVQYLPTTNFCYQPKYNYFFSDTMKHKEINVLKNNRVITSQGDSGYKSALLDKPLNESTYPSTKIFSFKISKSDADWIAVGMCHKKIVQKGQYSFNFSQINHGYYMISSNGGSWSSIQQSYNNVVKSFHFGTGDIIECKVQFKSAEHSYLNNLTFRCGDESYTLNFKVLEEDTFYPCVMLHYADDQVCIEPFY